MNNIIEKYKKHLQVNDLSYSTITSYINYVTHFLEQVNIDDITTESVENYFFTLKDKFAPRTLNLCKNALRNFFAYLNINNIKMPKFNKIPKVPPEFITLEFLENEVIPIVETICERGLKAKTILYFMFYTGLRVGDVAKIKRDDFNLENKTVKVYIKKSKKHITLPYPIKLKNILEQYFCSEDEKTTAFNITKAGIQSIFTLIKPYFKNINLHSHLMRHSYATHLLTKEMKITEIQFLMAHENIASTMIYAHPTKDVIFNGFWKKIK